MTVSTGPEVAHTGRRRGRVPALDGLRALAVTLVFLVHASGSDFPGGWIGVDVFFVISGYLITTLLLRERDKTGKVSLRAFYARRALRLVPALVVLVIVVTPFDLVGHRGGISDSVASLLYANDVWGPLANRPLNYLAHTWSLGVEEQFYLVWPLVLVALAIHRRLLVGLVITAGLVGIGVTAIGTGFVTVGYLYELPCTHLSMLCLGVLLAFGLADDRWAKRLQVFRHPVLPALALVATVVMLLTVSHYLKVLYLGPYTLIGVIPIVLICHVLVAPGSLVTRAVASGPAVWLGERSYGFYLWHFPILTFLVLHGWSAWAVFLLGLPASLVLTELSYRFVEQPFLRRKAHFERARLVPP